VSGQGSTTAVKVERDRGHWCVVRVGAQGSTVLARYTARRRAAEHADQLR
jgi:hypothetical protein